MEKVRTLANGIESESDGTPLVLKVKTKKIAGMMVGGTHSIQEKTEFYICISQLPPELQERIKTAVQLLLTP